MSGGDANWERNAAGRPRAVEVKPGVAMVGGNSMPRPSLIRLS